MDSFSLDDLPVGSKAEQADLILAQTYAEIFDSPGGRMVWEDLQRRFMHNPFDATNPHVTSYACGRIEVIEHILEQITIGHNGPKIRPDHM